MTEEEEAQLLALARSGDIRAFGRLIDAAQVPVRAFARRLVRNTAEAEDIAQDAFARAFETLARFDGRARFRTYVCGIAYRIWRAQTRAWFRTRKRETSYAAEATPPSTLDADQRLALHQAMAALPDAQRAAVALCLAGGFTHEEAAVALGLPVGTVKSHVARGRERLHKALAGDFE